MTISARMRSPLRSLSLAVAGLGLTVLTALPASAAPVTAVAAQDAPAAETGIQATWKYVYYGSNWARVDVDATVEVPVDVFDGENDGYPVYVDVDETDGGLYRHWDYTYDSYASRAYYDDVYRVRVCEYRGSGPVCSSWMYS